jgi:predicted O-methyltransferase YrrM
MDENLWAMDENIWATVDTYITDRVVQATAEMSEALASAEAAGLPPIAVSAPQGKLLNLLARMVKAQRILEIGTLGAYSTIWLAKGLPTGGRLLSLEISDKHAEVARANLARAGLDSVAEVRVGPALESLPKLEAEGAGPFDLFFIDADKANIPEYFDWAVRLSHPGSVIVVDNVVRQGALADPASSDPNVVGVRKLHELIADRDDVSATTIQTVGSKGYDGLTFAVVNG